MLNEPLSYEKNFKKKYLSKAETWKILVCQKEFLLCRTKLQEDQIEHKKSIQDKLQEVDATTKLKDDLESSGWLGILFSNKSLEAANMQLLTLKIRNNEYKGRFWRYGKEQSCNDNCKNYNFSE